MFVDHKSTGYAALKGCIGALTSQAVFERLAACEATFPSSGGMKGHHQRRIQLTEVQGLTSLGRQRRMEHVKCRWRSRGAGRPMHTTARTWREVFATRLLHFARRFGATKGRKRWGFVGYLCATGTSSVRG